ncbi:fumarylacetoacetate hydrolase family protein [Pullulanibacillus sp. KACC 23026]|uniref:fumarylacetoacetate hydrolase family protein n=1 Tax=Pullulanibacillus sp. KACC 23026 TaxID=3028315 RepID=UPI0023AED800|nr:fumarylacetoacetate hydrolase family protein [Pullulanibacillus sp. KACC 23026]WEG11072.1 fumarylacetoacetate hydrolase family protein [Pullulanibacillus sp. KACC 23026]
MKLLSIDKNGTYILGVKTEEGIIDMEEALKEVPSQDLTSDVMDVIRGGQERLASLQNYINNLDRSNKTYVLNEETIEWGPSVTRPNKIICVGLNYRKHADETNAPYPKMPILFNKFNNTLTGHKKDIAIPKVTDKLDYEVELAVIIGKKAKYVSEDEALNYVFGYSTSNDLSARDLQLKTPQWLPGKSCDDFSPLGPYLVSADEVREPNNLSLKTIVNGEVRQESNTSDMIFSCAEIISYISDHMTLEPGDIILTGTPEGVVLGYPEEKQVYLKPGDVVTVEVENLGKLENKFKKE